MAFRPYIPSLNPEGPLVGVEPWGFRFTVDAANLAGLDDSIYWTKIQLDHEERCIAFEFLGGTERPENALKLQGGKGRTCTAKALVRHTPWIRAVASLRDRAARKFEIFRHPAVPQFWTIRLAPWFELSVRPEDIGSVETATGIYRYLDADGEIIYIGKGKIEERFRSAERREWGIVKIEYSEIGNEGKQYEWESFHLERFRERHNNRLPHFNRVGGRS